MFLMSDPGGADRRTLFTGARLIDREGTISGPTTITVQGGLITAVDSDSVSLPENAGDEVINCRGMFISPGLVNLHTHSPMNIFKGIAEDVTPDDWFNREIWPYESKMEPADVEAGARLAVAEMLDYGV
ncbi:MAG: amidohydrolase family protein, partial [Spirochaetaceae bacterium]|nr:amidohydrolase family protein [Spirochaetaceae bacterium]